jgi:hypothetical protein
MSMQVATALISARVALVVALPGIAEGVPLRYW